MADIKITVEPKPTPEPVNYEHPGDVRSVASAK